jgi:hypothetical protein
LKYISSELVQVILLDISLYICLMDIFKDLYRVLILFSAGVILLGFILNLRLGKKITSSMKMLLILAVVNLASMFTFLLDLKSSSNSDINITLVFIDSVILILNLIIGRYVHELHTKVTSRFDYQIKHLFLFSFVAECVFLILIFTFRAEANFFDKSNSGFPYILLFILTLLVWGSVMPGIKSFISIVRPQKGDKRTHLLLVLNMLNNTIGVLFFALKFPSEDVGLFTNMLINIIFAYYYGYYMISSYFEQKKTRTDDTTKTSHDIYNWTDLKKHLNHWSETKAYLNQFDPDLIEKVDNCPLSDLEKIHYTLRLLNIKSKDIAETMNISSRAVEMQRYRINKKVSNKT